MAIIEFAIFSNFLDPQSNDGSRYQKMLWMCSLKCKSLLNFNWFIRKFHNRHHVSVSVYSTSWSLAHQKLPWIPQFAIWLETEWNNVRTKYGEKSAYMLPLFLSSNWSLHHCNFRNEFWNSWFSDFRVTLSENKRHGEWCEIYFLQQFYWINFLQHYTSFTFSWTDKK